MQCVRQGTTLAQVVLQQQQQQAAQSRSSPQPKQLLISIPPPSMHSPLAGAGSGGSGNNTLPSPHLRQQSPSIMIKQSQVSVVPTAAGHEHMSQMHSQGLHIINSKGQGTAATKNESMTVSMQQQPQIYSTYSPQTIPQQQQSPNVQQASSSVQDSFSSTDTTAATTPGTTTVMPQKLMMTSGMLGLSGHPLSHHPAIQVIQTKTAVPKQSPTLLVSSGANSPAGLVHLQHPGLASAANATTATPSPPPMSPMPQQQQQLLVKPPSDSPLLNSAPTNGGPAIVPLLKPSTPQPLTQQQQQPQGMIAVAGMNEIQIPWDDWQCFNFVSMLLGNGSLRTVPVPTISPQGSGPPTRVGSILLSTPSIGGLIPAHFDGNGTVRHYINN